MPVALARGGHMLIIGIGLGASNSTVVLPSGRRMTIADAEGVTLGGKAFPTDVVLTADMLDDGFRELAAANGCEC